QFAEALGHFEFLGASHLLRARKPEQEFYAGVQRQIGMPHEQVLFIDDLPENVAAAKGFGWQAVQYPPGASLAPELARFGIEFPSAVP
ncbi:MAG: HAD-IA family hydrolase, partial [Gemmataceae bacterium]